MLVSWVQVSTQRPLMFGDDDPYYGVIQDTGGEPTMDAWGYLAWMKGYRGHVGMPLPDEAAKLWERAGFGEVTREEWSEFTMGYCACRTRDAWLQHCRIWFGSAAVEKAVSE
jgi:hypothetical protein